MLLRVNEAIARAQTNGKKTNRKMVAALLWPDSKEGTQQVNMTYLCNGKTLTIRLEWIEVLCKELGCTPNYLFGFNEENESHEQ